MSDDLRRGPSGPIATTDNIVNGSSVPGATITEALNNLSGSSLPPGEFEGQALYWDGAAWAPVPSGVGGALRIDAIRGVDDPDPGEATATLILGGATASLAGTVAQLSSVQALISAGPNYFTIFFGDGIGGDPETTITGNAAGLQLNTSAIGFLAATPIGIQSITGVTTQNQVDSIVAALVAFGLVSDDR